MQNCIGLGGAIRHRYNTEEYPDVWQTALEKSKIYIAFSVSLKIYSPQLFAVTPGTLLVIQTKANFETNFP